MIISCYDSSMQVINFEYMRLLTKRLELYKALHEVCERSEDPKPLTQEITAINEQLKSTRPFMPELGAQPGHGE